MLLWRSPELVRLRVLPSTAVMLRSVLGVHNAQHVEIQPGVLGDLVDVHVDRYFAREDLIAPRLLLLLWLLMLWL